jgi:hypothetical protein
VQKTQVSTQREPVKLPAFEESDVKKGREYLQKRGITLETITRCEKAGMLNYTGDGVLFVGRDENGKVQNVTKRSTNPNDPVQKRDLKGSDKSYAVVITGESKKVWIVEGGTDALAVLEFAKRQNEPAPTVIISGGANVKSYLERPAIQSLLKSAEKVGIAGENEKDKESQKRADTGRLKQIERIKQITSCEFIEWKPPEKYKDLADLNEKKVAEIEQKKKEELQKNQKKERSRGPEMSM